MTPEKLRLLGGSAVDSDDLASPRQAEEAGDNPADVDQLGAHRLHPLVALAAWQGVEGQLVLVGLVGGDEPLEAGDDHASESGLEHFEIESGLFVVEEGRQPFAERRRGLTGKGQEGGVER